MMACTCPSRDPRCFFRCLMIWYAKNVVKRGGTFGLVADNSMEQAIALLDQLDEQMGDEINYDLITSTAEKLHDMKQSDAAFALSHSLTSGLTFAIANNLIPVEESK